MPTTLLLFSEGLDSYLAGKLMKRQGIKVIAVRFITPFFGWSLKQNPAPFYDKVAELGFDEGKIIDITNEYLDVLNHPAYGYGSYANPCIDCKMCMLHKALEIMEKEHADFITTGEVVGQRPMSQNKQAMNLIQRKSGAEDILLRPLCAKLLPPTLPEQKGWVNREELLAISGRSREEQLKLAREFGIKDIPSPAGGCLLTDPAIGSRVQKVLRENRPLTPLTAELLTLGRHIFEEDRWMVLGRNREENRAIFDLVHPHHLTYSLNEPSPLAVILQGEKDEEALKKWLMKYSKKAREAIQRGENVKVTEIKTKNEI
ncbi:MAG: hypothetical protein PHN83_04820 [Dysgonamonadaceae bacterium]|jgi:tRNA-specific 2-thiouridylase|nr:hypothetical protein [Dysgonamonadaceae bacterium]MDD4379247.1 hypothetical protein [Dysgonamonadaceae bacterium]